MKQHPEIYYFTWSGIEIEATYWPVRWGVSAHLEVRSIMPERAPLPISDTGYRSHFHPVGTIEARGGDVIAQVIAWLDEESGKPAWRTYDEANRQGELF